MNILVINYEYPPIGGGGGFVTRDMFEYLAAQGNQITVLTSRFGGLKETEIKNGVHIVRVPVVMRKKTEVASILSMLSYVPSAVFYVAHYLKKTPIDIINTHFAIPSGPAGMIISKILNIPNVLTIHGGDIYDPSKKLSPHRCTLLKKTVKTVLKSADCVVAQSTDTRDNAKKYYCPNVPIKKIPLGIPAPVYKQITREQFGLKDDQYIFCTIGRLVKRKNISDSLVIIKKLSKSINIKFIIIGDGPEKENLHFQVNALGLTDLVLFLGNVEDAVKFQALSISDCYLSTAMHEGFGLVFLEAMACGLPIACYDEGGQTDFLDPGKTGVLAKKGELDSLFDGIMLLIKNKEMGRAISLYNKKLVQNYYIDSCADRYRLLFQSTLTQA